MKIHERSSDRKAEAYIRADGVRCEEFNDHFDEDDFAQCTFVPVRAGQSLIVDASFSGSTSVVFFDLLIDGVLRSCTSTTRNVNRKTARFDVGYFYDKAGLKEATFVAQDFNDKDASKPVPGADNVGMIEVRISPSRSTFEPTYTLDRKNAFDTVASWRDVHPQPSYLIAPPTHEVGLQPVQSPVVRQPGRLTSRIKAARPGTKPWVVMRFMYRGKDVIDAHGFPRSAGGFREIENPEMPQSIMAVVGDDGDEDTASDDDSDEDEDEDDDEDEDENGDADDDEPAQAEAPTDQASALPATDNSAHTQGEDSAVSVAVTAAAGHMVQSVENDMPTNEAAHIAGETEVKAKSSVPQGKKRAAAEDAEEMPAPKKVKVTAEDIEAVKAQLEQKKKELEEIRKRREQTELQKDDARVRYMAALQKQMQETEAAIEVDKKLEQEAIAARVASESAIRDLGM